MPPDVLTTTDSVTVTITVAMDTVLANSADHDPSFGISDGVHFVGFLQPDKTNYHGGPCQHIEGNRGNGILLNAIQINSPTVASRKYSSETMLQIRPAERWGSCHTEHDEGYTNIANYQHLLDLTKGLYLEMYHGGAREKYRIKYIKVEIDID